jgi:hypothetical protein
LTDQVTDVGDDRIAPMVESSLGWVVTAGRSSAPGPGLVGGGGCGATNDPWSGSSLAMLACAVSCFNTQQPPW